MTAGGARRNDIFIFVVRSDQTRFGSIIFGSIGSETVAINFAKHFDAAMFAIQITI